MMEIDRLSKDDAYGVMRELLYAFNMMWFLSDEWVKKYCPEKHNNEDYLAMLEKFGAYEAKRLAHVLDISKRNCDTFVKFLKHSHWAVFEDVEIEKVSATSFTMQTIDCSTQRAAKKWGMEYYDCGHTGCLIRKGFFGAIHSDVKVARLFTPPDQRPEGVSAQVSCKWRVAIEK